MFKSGLLKLRHALLACVVVVVALQSCKKDDSAPELSVSIEKAVYDIAPSGDVTVKVVASGNVEQDLTVPFTLSGSAVKGTDYNVSSEAFVIKAGTNSAEVKLTVTTSFSRDKSVKLELGNMPGGLKAGSNASTVIGVNGIVVYSFEKKNNTMTSTAEVTVSLSTATGAYVAEREIRIPVQVDATASTAVLGTHFTFAGTQEVVIPAGKSKGSVTLNFVKLESGKDKVVLKAGPLLSNFAPGANEKSSIVIFGSSYDQLKGTWKYVEFSNYDWLVMNSSYADDEKLLPTHNSSSDKLSFTDEGLKVEMAGDLKNYFRDATLTNLGEIDERLQEVPGFPKVKMQLVKLSAANVNFSSSKQNVREAEIGFRYYRNGNKDMLEVTVRDYEPTDFLQNIWSFYKNDPSKMTQMPIRYQFERVSN